MKEIIKKSVEKIFNLGLSKYQNKIDQKLNTINSELSQIEQKRLSLYYKQLLLEKKLPNITDVGFRVFSQNDEDGILLYLFALIGTTNKIAIDLAFASPVGANTTNLLCNHGWSGLLICADEKERDRANKFFFSHPDTMISPPRVVNKWITAENINEVVSDSGLSGEIDLFSLDVDGVDYWLWKKLDAISPRIVVVECQTMWGKEKAITVPYRSDFNRFEGDQSFFGASLPAFEKLAKEKRYRLVAGNKYGFNAFFIKNELAKDILPTLSLDEYFELYAQPSWLVEKRKERVAKVKDMPWAEV